MISELPLIRFIGTARSLTLSCITLCVIGIEGGNAECQKLRIRGNFRAQVNVLPVAKLFHGFAKCGIGLELARLENQNSDKNSPKIGG